MAIEKVRESIQNNNLAEALQLLRKGISSYDKTYLSKIIESEKTYNTLKKNLKKGFLTNDDFDKERNRIVRSINLMTYKINEEDFSNQFSSTEKKSVFLKKITNGMVHIASMIAISTLILVIVKKKIDSNSNYKHNSQTVKEKSKKSSNKDVQKKIKQYSEEDIRVLFELIEELKLEDSSMMKNIFLQSKPDSSKNFQ